MHAVLYWRTYFGVVWAWNQIGLVRDSSDDTKIKEPLPKYTISLNFVLEIWLLPIIFSYATLIKYFFMDN